MLEVLVGLVAVACGWLLVVDWRRRSYWSRRGVPQEAGLPLVGASLPLVTGSRSEVLRRLYWSHPSHRWVGLYEGSTPCLLVRDSSLAAALLTNPHVDRPAEPCYGLFGEAGPRWTALRRTLSPLLAERLIDAVPLLKASAVTLNPEDPSLVSIVPLCSSFAVSFVGAWAFNQDLNPDESFTQKALSLVRPSPKSLLASLAPRTLNLCHKPRDVTYFTRLFTDNLAHRKENGIIRNDLLQMLASLKQKGFLDVPHKGETEKTDKIELTDEVLGAHAASVVSPGCEGLVLALTYTLLELAAHPDHQETVRKELVALGPHPSLSLLTKPSFLSNCLKEALRLHPVIGEVTRETVEEMVLTEGLELESSTRIFVSLSGIFSDPDIHHEPQLFNPHRFDKPLPPGAFMPFGHGPRTCIGEALTELVVKAACLELLPKYRLTLSPDTPQPLSHNTSASLNWPSVPVLLHFSRIPQQSIPS